MTVEKLEKELRKIKNKKLQVQMYAHDHDPERSDEGVGFVHSVDEVSDETGYKFVALHA